MLKREALVQHIGLKMPGISPPRLYSVKVVGESAKAVLVGLNEENVKAFEAELKQQNAEALFVKANITIEEEISNVFKKTIDAFG